MTAARPALIRMFVAGFRNLAQQHVNLHPHLQLLVGANGQGKTSFLEAIYVLAAGRSFRGASRGDLIRHQGDGYRLTAAIGEAGGELLIEREEWERPERRRQVRLGGKPTTGGEALRHLPAIAITAEQMGILRGSPDDRRRFVDRGLALENPSNLVLLRKVSHLQRQRTALLSSTPSRDALGVWNRQLAEAAAELRARRRAYIDDIAARTAVHCARIHPALSDLTLNYRPSPVAADEAGALLAAFESVAGREIAAGRSLVGPSRDEVEILSAGHAVRQALSAGQQKAVVLAMKLSKIERLMERTGRRPLLLLDDLDAELDRTTLERFVAELPRDAQILATSAKPTWVEPVLAAFGEVNVLSVTDGRLEAA